MNGTKEVRISLHQEDESAFPANYPVASVERFTVCPANIILL